MDTNKFFQSKTFLIALWGMAGLIIVLAVFRAGMIVGFHKAEFSYAWEENYHRNFAGPQNGYSKSLPRDFDNRNFIGSHGVIGQIIKIDASTLVIRGRDNIEKVVLVTNNTSIQRFRDAIKLSDLKIDDYIVVIGSPNSAGQITAKFIRLVPSPSSMRVPLAPFSPHINI